MTHCALYELVPEDIGDEWREIALPPGWFETLILTSGCGMQGTIDIRIRGTKIDCHTTAVGAVDYFCFFCHQTYTDKQIHFGIFCDGNMLLEYRSSDWHNPAIWLSFLYRDVEIGRGRHARGGLTR